MASRSSEIRRSDPLPYRQVDIQTFREKEIERERVGIPIKKNTEEEDILKERLLQYQSIRIARSCFYLKST
jgi:hypothetical protein